MLRGRLMMPGYRTGDLAARAIARRLFRRLAGGQLTVIEGQRRERFGQPGELEATLHVMHPALWRTALAGGGVGFAEAYMGGLWDSDDVVAVLRVLARNIDRINRLLRNPLTRIRTASHVLDRFRAPTSDDDRRNIQAHYDLGDDFFKLFLDPTMAYSCALFERPDMSLEQASTAKFERLCRQLGITSDSHVIEIGTGWGGFAVHAARQYGCRVTTTTISDQQYAYAQDLVRREELQGKVEVLREHYRDLRGTYTHLVSVEMIEAVDWRLYDEFFATIQRLLRPDGLAAIQAIVVDDREFERSKRWQDFIKRYIFPGGCLPSIAAMLDTTKRVTDLSLVDLHDIGRHYATTLRHWRSALDSRIDEARAMGLTERFLRMWRYYFAYCEAGFAERRISDVQMVFARPGWRPPQLAHALAGVRAETGSSSHAPTSLYKSRLS
jgi:cyclopropane-fatty-acyl-phospholipid synthase